ncbi:HAMP domain-containing sensor histidine kinase [Nocardioides sp.]|uniref:sensor histidine kinase n=1 Tax=Nocardioides sp. TaxID=35761 RepID=UPI002BD7275A|nr:HAMP domain-containing sensor histidine kinase [Nocardioides sp.]HSX69218.1 HAMP domain-containing sensor histidine kinase [Nocardioides sp.]
MSSASPARAPGLSVRLKLTLSYAGLVVLAGGLLLAVVWVFLLRYVPEQAVQLGGEDARRTPSLFVPGRNDLIAAFLPKASIAMGALLVFGLVGGWLLAGRMLAPLSRIAEATRRAGGGSLGHRVALEGRRDEFRDLADTFDAMLARLEAHVEEQRRFAANASHELRTPLAVTQTLLEVAREDPGRDVDALVDRLLAVNTRAIGLTEALLLLSRAERRNFTRAPVDLSLVAEEAAETLLPLAEKRSVAVKVVSEAASASGSEPLLLQLVTNLVHNAIVHNHADGRVWVSTSAYDGVAQLVVANTGEVLAPGLVSTLAEPFQRGTARVRADQAGVGLGLAIARSIAEAHDGSLVLAARPEGGLTVTVALPLA